MSARPRFADLERALAELPETVIGEILFGRLVTQPRPATKHAVATTALAAALVPPFQRRIGGPGGWSFLFEPELLMGPHVLVPDFAGWRVETLPEMPNVARLAIAPDFVCEVLSTSTESIDRDEKMLIYGANGVGHLWFVDPRACRVEAYRSERGRWSEVGVFEGDGSVRIEPFDAIELPLAWLWGR